ncbi:major facilitator superfamily domain-containing protein [Aspergillus pseudodeflectus]|uniref:Major facilitator superfamily domain-containing protein n=1 Tax=Aspergillus pseudodeflectus TaxID=176178 RepID=A0ABR4K390_9EURO
MPNRYKNKPNHQANPGLPLQFTFRNLVIMDPDPEKSLPQTGTATPNSTSPLQQKLASSPAHSAPQSSGYSLPRWRKSIILFTVSWMALAVTFSSTSLLPATPEIASEFHTTPEILNVMNAGVLLAMGFSTLIWGPLRVLLGRRLSYNIAVGVLVVCSVCTGAAQNMAMFTVFRVLGGLTGTSFMVMGQTVLADIFEPVVRGTAVGFFMLGTVAGPAIGPCIGGVIVTFASWRNIYWLQTAMAGLGLILSLLFVPEIEEEIDPDAAIDSSSGAEKKKNKKQITMRYILHVFNPLPVFKLWLYPNMFFSFLTCGLLSTFLYALLSSARTIFNPRFNLTSALVSGLFYLAPGSGFLIGSVLGGRLADMTVRRYIKTRGFRLPQDRLNSGLVMLFLVLPGATLVYAWSLQEEKGGMALPIVAGFVAGVGLMGSFNGLNTYAAEALPSRRSEVISGKYIIQYTFSAGASALVVPVIDDIGVGWTFTISAFMTLTGAVLVVMIARWGIEMQRWVERRIPLEK